MNSETHQQHSQSFSSGTLVDVVVPAFNAGLTISEAIASVLTQSVRPANIIVVDDGSVDDTASTLRRLEGVTLISKSNGGQGSARQRGAAVCQSAFLLFLDADDILLPEAIERLNNAIQACPGASVAYGRSLIWDPQSGATGPDFLAEHDAEGEVWGTLISSNFIRSPGCALIRRSILESVGGWDPDRKYQGNEDWELWLRLAEAGSFVRVPECVLKYRAHAGGYSRDRRSMYQTMLAVFRKQMTRNRDKAEKRLVIARAEQAARERASEELYESARQSARSGKPMRSLRFLTSSVWISPSPLRRTLAILGKLSASAFRRSSKRQIPRSTNA